MIAAAPDQLAAPPPPVVPAPRRESAAIGPAAAVATVIVLIFLGAQLVNAALPARAGGSVDLGPVRVELVAGWQLMHTDLGPRLAKGSVAIDVEIVPYDGTAAELYDDFVVDGLAPFANSFSATPPAPISLQAGLPAVRGSYTGIFGVGEVEGQLTTAVASDTGIVFDAWGRSGTLRALLPEVETMIDSLEIVE